MRPIYLLLALSTALSPLAAQAQPARPDMGIAAVVGEEAISSYDVGNRIRFIVATARLSGTPDVVERIRPQVIRALIDERLQAQEAARNGISATPEEIDQAIAAIEQQRNMPPGTIFGILERNQVPRETFTDQIKAQLLWNKLIMKMIRPRVRVSDEEVRLASRKFSVPPPEEAPQAPPPNEYKIAVIALPVDKPQRDGEIRAFADKLVGEMRAGASFEEVSRQFSSVTASAGGKVETFWVRPEQLDKRVARALAGVSAGAITEAVRTNEGYTIIKVFDLRTRGGSQIKKPQPEAKPKETEVTLKEILLKLKADATPKEADVMLAIGEEVAKHPGTCEEQGIASLGNVDDFDIEVNFIRKPMSELPPAVQAIAGTLQMGQISTPFASYEGIRLYMLCGKRETDAPPVDRERLSRQLMQEKIELESQKYLRNLRREAFIDIR